MENSTTHRRLTYSNWIAETGAQGRFAPMWAENDDLSENRTTESIRRQKKVEKTVRRAVNELPQDARELVIRYHFMGQSIGYISEATGRRKSKLAALLRSAHRILKKRLAAVLGENYGASSKATGTCPVCESPHRAEINLLIDSRDRARTWRPVIAALRQRYGIKITAPQVLIGHEKYHN